MKRRSFLKNSAMAAGLPSMAIPALEQWGYRYQCEKSIFELRVYHISRANNAKKPLGTVLQRCLDPVSQ